MTKHAKETLGFILFLFLFVIGTVLDFKGPWPWSLIGSIMLGCWIGWVWQRGEDRDHLAPSVKDELTIFCPRCKAARACRGSGFRIDGKKFSPDPGTDKLQVVESNFHLYNCKTCGRTIWVQLVVVSNPISITVGEPAKEDVCTPTSSPS